MSASDAEPQHVPARTIPVPGHLSATAQRALGQRLPDEVPAFPPLGDIAGWREYIAAKDQVILGMVASSGAVPIHAVREVRAGDAAAFELIPEGLPSGDRRVYLDIHGGALISGSGKACLAMAGKVAARVRARVVSVDYRMPPDHPFPAGLDDCLTFYRSLLRDHAPHEIVVGGASAGGNLAAAMVLKARDEGLPLPAAVVLVTPEVDLTESGDTFATNLGVDRTLRTPLMPANLLYAGGLPLTNPYLSPLFGDFSKGFPPTLLTAGTRDLFLSNAVRMHRALRKAGVAAELHVVEALSHGSFGGGAEDDELDEEIRRFCEAHWARG